MSPYRSFVFSSATLPMRLRWLVPGWICAEIVTFVILVHLLGIGLTLLLGLATTVLGVVLMRRLGLETMRGLRRSFDGAQPPDGALLDGLLAALGCALLILPGFLANGAGLALAAPSVRRTVVRQFGGAIRGGDARRVRRSGRTDIIDLDPEDYRTTER